MKEVKILHHKNNRFLFIDDDLWMWDTPREQNLQKRLSEQAFGDVLVAGYGFGIITKFLLENPRVISVITIEKYSDVLNAVKKFDRLEGKIIVCDFYDLPDNKKFDCIVGDIWQDIDAEFLGEYIRFKKKAKKLVKKDGKILAWGKDFFEYLLNKSQKVH
jgi:16S rRNA A1518/A1519 N6-dimethyltransferase RsmA/KsgA/DIM1 with predicted DNA glycosylase/AP lyase activity